MKTIIKNGLVISPNRVYRDPVDILIENSTITEIKANLEVSNAKVIDADEKLVLPGLIDMHCFLGEPGYEYRENIETASKSAAKGGFTSITCDPNTEPVIDNKTVVEYILSKQRTESVVNIFPYGSMSKRCLGKEITEIGEMKFAGVVAISDGDSPIMDSNLIQKILRYASMFDIPVITHCEDVSLSNGSGINEGYVATYLGLKGSPKSAEEVMLARNIILAANAEAHLHVTHVSTKGAVELIRNAKKSGIRITAETSPHYFTLTERSVLNYNTHVKLKNPLRTANDITAILEGIQDNTIDVISSSHVPNTLESKNTEFDIASFGISSFETAFSLAYTNLVANKLIRIEQLVEKMSSNPADILALNKGHINIGGDADLIIIDPNSEYIVDAHHFSSKAKFSPFDGMNLKGEILYTLVNGRVVL